jgi:hypothetical protein
VVIGNGDLKPFFKRRGFPASIKDPEHEIIELRKSNEILKLARAFLAPVTVIQDQQNIHLVSF